MAIKNTALTSTQVSALLDPVPAGASYAVTVMMVCNTATPDPQDEDAGADTLTVYIINGLPASSAAPQYMVVNSVTIRAGETFTLDTEKVILEENDTIAAISGSGTDLSAMVSYVEI